MGDVLNSLFNYGVVAAAIGAIACGTPRALAPKPPTDLKRSAAAFYEAYGQALRVPHREAIATFYHAGGALRVFNGQGRRLTRAALDSSYRGPWSPPAYFAWDNLAFDSVAPGEVLVTGGFQWQGVGQPDTSSFIYVALLQAVDSGLAITFEHETSKPRR